MEKRLMEAAENCRGGANEWERKVTLSSQSRGSSTV